MIEIIIPTLGRVDKQVTLDNLPDKWKSVTTLVVQEHEHDEMKQRYSDICNIWCLPPETFGISWTRKHIAEHWKGKRIFVMDDDLKFVQLTDNGEKMVGAPAEEKDFDHMFSEVERLMDEGIMHGGLGVNNTPPSTNPYNHNSRVYTNMFFSEQFPVDEIDFGTDYELMPEDFFITLQLLTAGHQNVCFNHFRVNPSATNAKGGCETFRTIENHNRGQEILAEKFPEFVTVTTKVQTSGPWAGMEKKALSIKWKKAYESSQKPETSLESFFG